MDFRKYSYNKDEREEATKKTSARSNSSTDDFSVRNEDLFREFESSVRSSVGRRQSASDDDDAIVFNFRTDDSDQLNTDLFSASGRPGRRSSSDVPRFSVEDEESEEEERKARELRRKERHLAALKRQKRRRRFFLFFVLFVIIFVMGVVIYIKKSSEDTLTSLESQNETPTEAETDNESSETALSSSASTAAPSETAPQSHPYHEAVAGVSMNPQGAYTIPSWITQDLLTVSKFNRPGELLSPVRNIVVHYVGNPGSSAKDNRDYFEDLSNPKVNPTGHGASSNFIVGLHGEIVQCVPLHEVAFANYPRNYDTVSIEVCHPDAEGKFTDTTYASLIKLIAFLCQKLNLTEQDVIRHFDVSGKECPIYYVHHPEAFEQMKADVRTYLNAHPDIQAEFP